MSTKSDSRRGQSARPSSAARLRPEDYLAPEEIETVQRWLGSPGIAPTETSNAVARICLNGIQERLPQWAMARPGTEALTGRAFDRHRPRAATLQPGLLFELNWADSGPGFSWPEAYYVTFLPGFDRWVVTMSVDSTDAWGVTDLALGAFGKRAKVVTASGRIIMAYWREHHCDDPGSGGWEYLLDTGLVDEETAHRWRTRVWPPEGRGRARRTRGQSRRQQHAEPAAPADDDPAATPIAQALGLTKDEAEIARAFGFL